MAAFNSINNASGERMVAFEVYDAHARDMTLPKDATPYGAKTHLENAFNNIKEMQSLNSELMQFSRVDIALCLAANKNRGTLRPHIEAVFSAQENK